MKYGHYEPVASAHDYNTVKEFRQRLTGPIPQARNPHGWNTPIRIGSKQPRMEKVKVLLAKWHLLAPESRQAIEKDYANELEQLRRGDVA